MLILSNILQKNLQREVERAGGKVIDHMMNLDQASDKLDTLREKLDASQQKLQMLANHISQQQKFLKEKEKNLIAKVRTALQSSFQEFKLLKFLLDCDVTF